MIGSGAPGRCLWWHFSSITTSASNVGQDVPEQIDDLKPARRLEKQQNAPQGALLSDVTMFPVKNRHAIGKQKRRQYRERTKYHQRLTQTILWPVSQRKYEQ